MMLHVFFSLLPVISLILTFINLQHLIYFSLFELLFTSIRHTCVGFLVQFFSQDTVKYVENHVQKVRASVREFYSDVMEDLLPPSSLGPEEVANS